MILLPCFVLYKGVKGAVRVSCKTFECYLDGLSSTFTLDILGDFWSLVHKHFNRFEHFVPPNFELHVHVLEVSATCIALQSGVNYWVETNLLFFFWKVSLSSAEFVLFQIALKMMMYHCQIECLAKSLICYLQVVVQIVNFCRLCIMYHLAVHNNYIRSELLCFWGLTSVCLCIWSRSQWG